MSYALDVEEISVANCGSNINISAEKRLDTQHQYEQGHKKPVFLYLYFFICQSRAGESAAPVYPYCACYHQIVRAKLKKKMTENIKG